MHTLSNDKMRPLGLRETNLVLDFPTTSGAVYQLYGADTLASTNWAAASAPITGHGATMYFQFSDMRPQRFYRLQATLP